jgi:Tfp pilus assembly protein PilF
MNPDEPRCKTKFHIRVYLCSSVVLLALLASGCPRLPSVPVFVKFSDPLTAEEHTQLGAVYEREGNWARAAEEYGAAAKKDPKNVVALTGLGNVASREGHGKIAVSYYRKALEVDEANAVVHNNLALALISDGKTAEALTHAERAVALSDGADPRCLDTRAQARLASGDRAGALADLTRASELCAGADQSLASACLEIKDRLRDLGP